MRPLPAFALGILLGFTAGTAGAIWGARERQQPVAWIDHTPIAFRHYP